MEAQPNLQKTNVVKMHAVDDTPLHSNVVSMRHTATLNIVELDNVVDIQPTFEEPAPNSCVDGVCSLNWKPKRPTAA